MGPGIRIMTHDKASSSEIKSSYKFLFTTSIQVLFGLFSTLDPSTHNISSRIIFVQGLKSQCHWVPSWHWLSMVHAGQYRLAQQARKSLSPTIHSIWLNNHRRSPTPMEATPVPLSHTELQLDLSQPSFLIRKLDSSQLSPYQTTLKRIARYR